VWVTAALIVALAFAARIYNVNWDENTHLHPDERGLTMVATNVKLPSSPAEYLSQEKSPLNPYNAGSNSYVYGNLPLTLTKVAAVIADREDYDRVVLVGRFLSALFSAATSASSSFAAAAFSARRRACWAPSSWRRRRWPSSTRTSSSLTPTSPFFTTAVLYFALRAQQEGKTRDFALAGLMVASHGLQADGGCHFAGCCGGCHCLRLAGDARRAGQSGKRQPAMNWPALCLKRCGVRSAVVCSRRC
jgi:hypothetical protein